MIKNSKRRFSTTASLYNDNESENYSNSDSESSSSEDEAAKVVFRKTIYKDLRKQVLKHEFDKAKIFVNPANSTEQDEIFRERVDLSDENKELRNDFSSVSKGKSAASKISQNVTPESYEFKSFEYKKQKINQLLKNLNEVRNYISEELKINESRSGFLKKIKPISEEKGKRKLEYSSEDEESSSSKKSRLSPSDYVDSLPKDYDPFDDVGTD